MLATYYHSVGLYTFSSSDSSEISGSSTSDESESEYEPDESSHYSDVSGNSHPSESKIHATPSIDVRQFIVASTSDYEMSESVSTDIELWSSSDSRPSASSSPSSLCTSTSQYSQDPLPSFAHLLDYSPSVPEQPQPTDSILIPKECMFDVKLRCPPNVEITRNPIVEQAICSFQNHPPPNIEEDYIQIINTSPEYIDITSESDKVCLD